MKENDYPEYDEHKAEHQGFVAKVNEFREKFEAEGTPALTDSVGLPGSEGETQGNEKAHGGKKVWIEGVDTYEGQHQAQSRLQVVLKDYRDGRGDKRDAQQMVDRGTQAVRVHA